MTVFFDELLIIALERDYPQVNVRPIATRIGNDPTIRHPEGALRGAVKKAQEKAESEGRRSREAGERRVVMEKEGEEFAEVYARFSDWFNNHLLECKKNNLSGPDMDRYFGYQVAEYEAGRDGKPMHPYFAGIVNYNRRRWAGGLTDQEKAEELTRYSPIQSAAVLESNPPAERESDSLIAETAVSMSTTFPEME
jgi:hypothetical protein